MKYERQQAPVCLRRLLPQQRGGGFHGSLIPRHSLTPATKHFRFVLTHTRPSLVLSLTLSSALRGPMPEPGRRVERGEAVFKLRLDAQEVAGQPGDHSSGVRTVARLQVSCVV